MSYPDLVQSELELVVRADEIVTVSELKNQVINEKRRAKGE